MSSKYNHSRQRTIPVKPIKPVITNNIDTVMIDVWAEQNDAREQKIFEKYLANLGEMMNINSNKIIIDLCGGTGSWSKPYKDAGYDVRLVTFPKDDVCAYEPPRGGIWDISSTALYSFFNSLQ